MILAVDIGNSTTKFGLFDGSRLTDKFSIHTKPDYEAAELMSDRLQFLETRIGRVNAIIAVSVVPNLNEILTAACLRIFKVSPIFVDHMFDTGMTLAYETPETLGGDRIVTAFAAANKYGAPCIVCGFGTATTIDAVGPGPEFLGGAIAPGMGIMVEALQLKTAQLPAIRIRKPDRVIGKTTGEAIASGIFWGNLGLVESLIRRIKAEMASGGEIGKDVPVIATGGFARLIVPEIPVIGALDENLTLEGLRLLGAKLN